MTAGGLEGLDHWHNRIEAAIISFIVVVVLAQLGVYSPPATPMNIGETERLVRGIGVGAVTATAWCIYSHTQVTLPACLLGFAVAVLLIVQRDIIHVVKCWIRQRGYGVQRVIVYGKQSYPHFARLLDSNPHLQTTCIGFVHDIPDRISAPLAKESGSLGPWSEVDTIATEMGVSEVLVAAPSTPQDKLADIVRDCERLNLRLAVALDTLDGRVSNVSYEFLGDVPVARYGRSPSRNLSILKDAMDAVGAAALLVLLSPLFALIALVIKLDSRGPVFFRHQRIGKDGEPFFLWKFRSMRLHTPAYEHSPTSESDTRLTRLGRVLRRLSIDELPQLVNVLRGDMSLVGPRPEMPFIVQRYGARERRRLKVKPGITGLWQISPARAMPIHDNLEFDLFYIDHFNLSLDCAILLRTITAVLRGIGAT
jgi:exopolysaccharide biosynthesis polyprenyl glycosylphosphotransferase